MVEHIQKCEGTSNSCNIGMSALPDMYAQARGSAVPERVRTYQAMHEFLCCK